MPTSPLAFLQPTARTILIPSPIGGGLPPGTVLGAWRLVSLGHRLGQHTRHAAVHRETGQQAVIELFDAPVLLQGDYTQCIRDALAALMRIEHLGAPVHHDVGMLVDGRPYVVREAIDGYGLDEMRADGAISERALINIVRGVCKLVMAAHAADIAHGALDLEQVLVRDSDATIVLLDWRITNVIAEEALRHGHVTTTSASRSPRAHTVAEDVFDIGVMMLRLLGEDMSRSVESLAFAMCADDPAVRPSLEIVLQRLAAAEEALDVPKTSTRVRRSSRSRGWRRSSLALACIAPTLVMVWHDDEPLVAANITPPAVSAPAPKLIKSIPAPPAPPPVKPVVASAPASAAPVPVAKPSVAPVAHAKAAVKPVVADGAFLHEYQRVGHDLLQLENALGPLRLAELRTAFREIHIDDVMKDAVSSRDAMVVLADLEHRIERLRPVEITGACKSNPLADGCQ